MDNLCVCCNNVIPEGRMICPRCENEAKNAATMCIGDFIKSYDYLQAMTDDILAWFFENNIDVNKLSEDEAEKIYESLFNEDSITGNGSGSYTFDAYRARRYLFNNNELYMNAADELNADYSFFCSDPESADVIIRCYLLREALDRAILILKKS